jgi:hypothetical protein
MAMNRKRRSMTTFESLITGLAREAGVSLAGAVESPVEFRHEGFPVVISEDRRTGATEIIVHARLGEVPEARELEVYRVLLEANVLWSATSDATLGVNSETRQAILCYRTPLAGLEPKAFALMLGVFIEVATNWANFIEAARTEMNPPPANGGTQTFIRA